MKVILVYDVNVKRVSKVLNTCRKYLHWIQNSVFEGEITRAKLEKLKTELKEIINDDEDSIVIFLLKKDWLIAKEFLGVRKSIHDAII